MENQVWKIFVDGASRGNPGPSGAGLVIFHDEEPILKKGFFLGKKTNNQAEYLALALAVFLAKKHAQDLEIPCPTLRIISDSELLIKQMNGVYRVKNPELAQLKALIDGMLVGIHYTCRHVMREHNTVADKLANQGVDTKQKMPTDFLNFLSNYSL
jgi:ribonuclease HI